MNSKTTRFKIFKIYADNLDYIVKNSSLKDSYDKGYGVYCPLCMKHFTSADELTLEHFPPYSLGGRDLVLTCKKCNNTTGHEVDAVLLNTLKEIDFYNFKPNSEKRIKVNNPEIGNNQINADLKFDENGKFLMKFDPQINNPEILDAFFNSEKKEIKDYPLEGIRTTTKLEFTTSKYIWQSNEKLDLSLLKIAYLTLFHKFGHIYLFTKSSEIIRDKILNPNENKIIGKFVLQEKFPDKNLGINIILEPKEFQSFLIVFDLKTKSDIYRISMVLPGFSDSDDNIYKKFKTFYSANNECKLVINNIIDKKMNVRNPENALIPIQYWEKYVT